MSKKIQITTETAESIILNIMNSNNTTEKKNIITQIMHGCNNTNTYSELLKYITDSKKYCYENTNIKIGSYVYVGDNTFWGSEANYYINNKLLIENCVYVKVIDFLILNEDKIKIEYTYQEDSNSIKILKYKEIYTSYIKELSLL